MKLGALLKMGAFLISGGILIKGNEMKVLKERWPRKFPDVFIFNGSDKRKKSFTKI
jgi:hypothetical protein